SGPRITGVDGTLDATGEKKPDAGDSSEEEKKDEPSEDEIRRREEIRRGKEKVYDEDDEGDIQQTENDDKQLKKDTAEAIRQSFISLMPPSPSGKDESPSSSSTSTSAPPPAPKETKESVTQAFTDGNTKDRYKDALERANDEEKRALQEAQNKFI